MVDGEVSAFDSNTSLPDLPEKKSGYTFGQNDNLLLISLYQKYEAYFSDVSIFVTQCLLVSGQRIPTGVFLCRQSELFRAFCSNHSYSRIVGKKNAPLDSCCTWNSFVLDIMF